MFYRENGQFKTSYRADQQIFPIAQDRIAYWKSVGAQASPTVERLVKQAAKAAA